MDDLFVTEQHPLSRRWAIVEDDGFVAWLYLSAPEATKPIATCWLYNRVAAPEEQNFQRGETPTVPVSFLTSGEPFIPPSAENVNFRWSPDGHSVAVFFGPELFGFIRNASRPGYSKLLSRQGPFGVPLDKNIYANVFKET